MPESWNKQNEVSKTNQIDKNKEINKYSDPYNFWGELLGEYEIYPTINQQVTFVERVINLLKEERNIELSYEKVEGTEEPFYEISWVVVNGVTFQMYYNEQDGERSYTKVVS